MKIRRKHPVRVNHLGSDPIPQLVRRLALPAMLAQFVNVLYSIIDRMYIGNIADVGDIALAGVGICGPIVTMISAFAAWIGNGGAPLLSIKSGEQNKEGASAILANCFVLLIGMAVCLTIGAYLCKDALLVWFGATERIFPYAETYMRIYLIGTVFAVLSLGLNQFIICQGFSNLGMVSVIIGAVLNILLALYLRPAHGCARSGCRHRALTGGFLRVFAVHSVPRSRAGENHVPRLLPPGMPRCPHAGTDAVFDYPVRQCADHRPECHVEKLRRRRQRHALNLQHDCAELHADYHDAAQWNLRRDTVGARLQLRRR